MNRHEDILAALSRSRFRSRFRLAGRELAYFQDKGMAVILEHARDFITQRLAPATPKNDGKQTPMRNHPVFVAQHATATCCRGCLAQWHKIPKGRELTEDEIDYVVTVIEQWLLRQHPKTL